MMPALSYWHGQVGVHVSWIATSSGHLFTSSAHLAERLAVVGHVRVDDQHVHVQIEGQVLGGGQAQPGCENPLYSRVVGQVEEHDCPLQGTGPLEVSQEVLSLFVGDAHGAEDNCERLGFAERLGLPGDLQSKVVVGQTCSREDGQLLAAHQGVCAVDGGDAGLDESARLLTGSWVDGSSCNISQYLGHNFRATVSGLSGSGQNASHDAGRQWHLDDVSGETDGSYPWTDRRFPRISE